MSVKVYGEKATDIVWVELQSDLRAYLESSIVETLLGISYAFISFWRMDVINLKVILFAF